MSDLLAGKRVVFAGKLGGANRRQARQLVRDHGGSVSESHDGQLDLVVVGEAELPLSEAEQQLDAQLRRAANAGQLEIISETMFWQRLGLVDDAETSQLYTPAMLARLLKIPVEVIRRWHRQKLIVPVQEVHRLPYFDFEEVNTARQLAKLMEQGIPPRAIERQLQQLLQSGQDDVRTLSQRSIIVEGKNLLVRQGDGLVEAGGQMRIDFEALEAEIEQPDEPATLSVMRMSTPTDLPTFQEMLELAAHYEDEGHLSAAAEMYRAALAAGGLDAEICFQLAEVLYRMDQVEAARERYYMAIEIDEDFVEARANLGCVLAETGQPELAIAAFEGALAFHPEYADVHYHLAKTLERLGQDNVAVGHWEQFLQLAPDSPWSDEARSRLPAEQD